MSSDSSKRPVRSEHWAIQVEARADAIKHQTHVAKETQQLSDEQRAVANDIDDLLRSVYEITRPTGRRYFALVDRWRGASIERAYRSVHAADILLVQLLPMDHLEPKIRSMMAGARTTLDAEDPRLLEMDRLTSEPSDACQSASATRAALQEAMRISYAAYDQRHVRVRHFRNLLFCSAALLALLMGVFAVIVYHYPTAVSFCFNPPNPPVEPTGPTIMTRPYTVCPSGNDKLPSVADVLIVAGLGSMGGALAAAFSIPKIGTSIFPYQVPIATAVLKIPSGALTGIVGIILLGGHFVPGFSELDEQRQILAYAIVFGYAQQLATRFVDDRAQSLHASVPSESR